MKRKIIGTVVKAVDVFDEITKWKRRCWYFTGVAWVAGVSIGVLVTHVVLR